MPYKDPEDQKVAQHRHYLRNADLYKQRGANWKRRSHGKDPIYTDLPSLADREREQINASGRLTIAQVAQETGTAKSSVRNAILRGRLRSERVVGGHAITFADMQAWDTWRKLPQRQRGLVGREREVPMNLSQRLDVYREHLKGLKRFEEAQALCYDLVLDELRAGHKTTHWSWFIFPQEYGLGDSRMSRTYGLKGRSEARKYLRHPVLGERLIQCAMLVDQHLGAGKDLESIFGEVDAMKVRSCCELFASVADKGAPYEFVFKSILRFDAAVPQG